jgi:hypothetical protein
MVDRGISVYKKNACSYNLMHTQFLGLFGFGLYIEIAPEFAQMQSLPITVLR